MCVCVCVCVRVCVCVCVCVCVHSLRCARHKSCLSSVTQDKTYDSTRSPYNIIESSSIVYYTYDSTHNIIGRSGYIYYIYSVIVVCVVLPGGSTTGYNSLTGLSPLFDIVQLSLSAPQPTYIQTMCWV